MPRLGMRRLAALTAGLLLTACGALPTQQPGAALGPEARAARYGLMSEIKVCPPVCTAYQLNDNFLLFENNIIWSVTSVDSTTGDSGSMSFQDMTNTFTGTVTAVSSAGGTVTVQGTAMHTSGEVGTFTLTYNLTTNGYLLDIEAGATSALVSTAAGGDQVVLPDVCAFN